MPGVSVSPVIIVILTLISIRLFCLLLLNALNTLTKLPGHAAAGCAVCLWNFTML